MIKRASFLTLISLIFAAGTVTIGQTTEFTFQGRLLDNSLPPTSSYDFEFRLFDAEVSGNELGSDSQLGVPVNAGVFTVRLDFGTQFDGTPRFLQIGVRPAGSPEPFTILDPRQPISSTPYAIRSLNAAAAETAGNSAQLGGVDAAEYVQDDDPRMTNERQPAPNSNHYIRNTTTEQTFADFSIGGIGKAGGFDTPSGYSIDGLKILGTTGQSSIFVGWSAGINNTGDGNTFVGAESGTGNTTAARNTFLGFRAGNVNQTGNDNSFVGNFAGFNNSASNNSFFGSQSGQTNTTGNANAFFGRSSGVLNMNGSRNSFFGADSGLNNVDGFRNTFIGASAGAGNSSGSFNVFVGDNTGLVNTTAGQNSFFGFSAGFNNSTGSNNVFVGQRGGLNNTTGNNNTFLGQLAGSQNTTGSHNVALGSESGFSTGALTFATAIGPGTIVASNNTIQLGRITREERVLVPGDLQVNGSIIGNLPTGSGSYIQNTATTQSSSNFNISGTGTANIFSAGTQYNIGSDRVLSVAGMLNLFVGVGSGAANIEGAGNTFVGNLAGHSSTASYNSSFFGNSAGEKTTTGISNSFFGSYSGQYNTIGRRNSFFGTFSGQANTSGDDNAFFGMNAGTANISGSGNAYFGRSAGLASTTGSQNSIFGAFAGWRNESHNNAFFGWSAGEANTSGHSNSFFGRKSGIANVSGTDNAFFGDESGMGNTTGQHNAFFGTLAGQLNTQGNFNTFVGAFAGNINTTGGDNAALGFAANFSTGNLTYATAIGAGAIVTASSRIQLGRNGQDTVSIGALAAATATNLCINGTVIASCSSSIRYKENVRPFGAGLNIIRDLRPVRFDWIGRDEPDVGLIAEEVEKVDPLLVTFNQDGEVQGVKYDRIGVVLINVVKEQQEQIEAQQRQIDEQEAQLRAMRAILCELMPGPKLCSR